MMRLRRNSHSALTARKRVDIRQDASTFYPSLERDTEAAAERLKALLAGKAKSGVEVRLLYDP